MALDRNIWQHSCISFGTKLRLYISCILPIFLYGVETWAVTAMSAKTFDALDQWCLRCILNIHWTERITNNEVRSRTQQPLLTDAVCSRRLRFFGHIYRADPNQDHSRALYASTTGLPKHWRRRAGRPRQTWLWTIENDLRPLDLGLVTAQQRAQNRTAWQTLVETATSSPEDDDDDDDWISRFITARLCSRDILFSHMHVRWLVFQWSFSDPEQLVNFHSRLEHVSEVAK